MAAASGVVLDQELEPDNDQHLHVDPLEEINLIFDDEEGVTVPNQALPQADEVPAEMLDVPQDVPYQDAHTATEDDFAHAINEIMQQDLKEIIES